MDLLRLWRNRRNALPQHLGWAAGVRKLALMAMAGLLAASLGAMPAQAAVPSPAPAASAAGVASARQVLRETRAAAAEPVAHQAAPSAWQRWGERLLALGVGAGVGWLLLRLGRDSDHDDARASRSDAR